MNTGLKIATRFATALDNEEYDVAVVLLAEDIEYTCRGETHLGPASVIATYQANGEVAKTFDSVQYQSEVTAELEGNF